MKKKIAAIFLTGLIVSACTSEKEPTARQEIKSPEPLSAINKIAATDPFEHLTIPYLRDRKYTSSLAELTQISSASTHTIYTTSYESDTLKINGLLTIPSGQKPENGWPAVVFVHGYIPPTLYKTTERYGDYVNYLARNGFVVFKIDLRGHGDSEGEAGGAYYSSDYVIDTLNARAALQSADFVDSQKIGLWGHSMAGNVTFRSFISAQDIPALVIWGGAGYTYQDLQEYRISDNSYRPPASTNPTQQRRRELFEKHGQYSSEAEFWRKVVPTNYLDGVTGSIQLHHAVNDDVVSVNYSRNLIKKLEGSSITHELYEYPSGGHNLTGSSFTAAMQRTVEFYKNAFMIE